MRLIETGDSPVNIALGNPAFQSSDWHASNFKPSIFAGNAVDGNMSTGFYSGLCTCTLMQQNPWWAVDLHKSQYIDYVIITKSDPFGNVYFVIVHRIMFNYE